MSTPRNGRGRRRTRDREDPSGPGGKLIPEWRNWELAPLRCCYSILLLLNAAEAAQMTRDCLRTATLPTGFPDLVARAEGVPFLIEELLAAAGEEGTLARGGGGWCSVLDRESAAVGTGPGWWLSIPPCVDARLSAGRHQPGRTPVAGGARAHSCGGAPSGAAGPVVSGRG